MKNFLDKIGTYLVIFIGIIVLIIFSIVYWIVWAINWCIEKIFKKKNWIPFDKWLDKKFSMYNSEFEE